MLCPGGCSPRRGDSMGCCTPVLGSIATCRGGRRFPTFAPRRGSPGCFPTFCCCSLAARHQRHDRHSELLRKRNHLLAACTDSAVGFRFCLFLQLTTKATAYAKLLQKHNRLLAACDKHGVTWHRELDSKQDKKRKRGGAQVQQAQQAGAAAAVAPIFEDVDALLAGIDAGNVGVLI